MKIKEIIILLLLPSVLIVAMPVSAFDIKADLIVVNGNVHTMDAAKPRVEAFAVLASRIVAVGSNAEIKRLANVNTKTIDAEGKLVLPGFNDSHVHFSAIGAQFFSVSLKDAKTPAEMIEKIKYHARFLPAGKWILGGGWNNANWSPDALPTKDLIDAAAPEHPVFLYHENAKSALVNSFALKLARIDKATKTVANGEILRDANGEPNGILLGSAMNLVKRFVPQPVTADKLAVAETASNYAAAFGVTSVQDVSADDWTEIYRPLARQGRLKTRVYDCIALSDWKKLAEKGVKRADGDAIVRRGCLKGMADGDAELTDVLTEEITAADRADLQVAVHAIGARANDQILSVYENLIKTNGKRDRRFRVEHAHRFRPSDIKRFAGSDIIASVQPFLFSDETGKSFDPLRNLLNANAALAFGSDSSIIEINPLYGIAAAVNTSDTKQKLSVEEAVRFYTLGSAYAEFQETEKGSITVGKLADFIILSDDIFGASDEKIRQTRVLKTIFDGRVVYEKK